MCGTGTVEGAPGPKRRALEQSSTARTAVVKQGFDISQPNGHIQNDGRLANHLLRVLFQKQSTYPNEATTEDIAKSYWLSWETRS